MTLAKPLSMLTAASLLLSPFAAFAASDTAATTTTDIETEDVMRLLEEEPAAMPAMDGLGGGGSYPGPFPGGVTVDAMMTKEVTPDFVAVSAYCDSGEQPSREAAREYLQKVYDKIKAEVGKDGRVRKSGTVSVYPFYDPMGGTSDKFSGSLSVFIRVLNMKSSMRIADIVEKHNCSLSWDVRLIETQDYELTILDDLVKKLNKRKIVFEKLLKKKLNTVQNVSLSTWVDGWSTYDPDTNKADATTTLSVTFSLSGRSSIR